MLAVFCREIRLGIGNGVGASRGARMLLLGRFILRRDFLEGRSFRPGWSRKRRRGLIAVGCDFDGGRRLNLERFVFVENDPDEQAGGDGAERSGPAPMRFGRGYGGDFRGSGL